MFSVYKIAKNILIGLLLLRCLPAQAQETVTLDQLINELLKSNPQIQAALARHQEALAKPSQARTLPDPLLFFVTRNNTGNPIPFTELGNDPVSSVGFMWEQEFPYPGKLDLAGKIAQKEADSVAADADTAMWTQISEIKQAYFDYFRATRVLGILTDSRDLLKRFEDIAEARYRVGEAIQQDVLRAQVEVSILDQRLTTANREKETAAAQINRILNRSIDAPLPDPANLETSKFDVSLETLQAEYAGRSPQIRSGQAMVQREQLNVNLAKRQYKPDFMSSVEYANSPNFPDMWEIQFGARIPIFYKKKQDYGVVEATQGLNRAEKELNAMKQEVAFNLKNEFIQIQASEKLLALYQQAIIPQSSLALESGISSYQVGKADFLTTISNFLTILEYRMNYFEELAKHESAIARLEQAVGHPLTVSTTGVVNHE